MGCDSSYMHPTGKEALLQATSGLLSYSLKKLGKKVPAWVVRESKDIYCSNEKVVTELCDLLRGLSAKKRDSLVYNAKDKTSRQLADWWEEHEEADVKREKKEKKESALVKKEKALLKKLKAKYE